MLSADQARQRAALIIARIRAAEEPPPLPLAARANGGPTVADLAARYLEEHVEVRLKPRTRQNVRAVLRNHILPALGRVPVAAVERRHVIDLQQSLSAYPVAANRTVKILSHMYRLGEGWGLAPEGRNPCRSVEKFPERSRERFLTDAEFARLGQVLDEAVADGRTSPTAVAAIRLLMLTGCRRSEILTLRWTEVDLEAGELRLADGKTGARTIHLSPSAVRVLTDLPHKPGNPWVIPGAKPGTHMTDIDGAWESIRAQAGLRDVRIHDIRHSFASRALALGEGLPIIGRLLGHRRIETTARYAHLARDSVRESAERIAVSIAADIL